MGQRLSTNKNRYRLDNNSTQNQEKKRDLIHVQEDIETIDDRSSTRKERDYDMPQELQCDTKQYGPVSGELGAEKNTVIENPDLQTSTSEQIQNSALNFNTTQADIICEKTSNNTQTSQGARRSFEENSVQERPSALQEWDKFCEEPFDINSFNTDENKKTKSHYCDVCLSRSFENIRIGVYLCFLCEKYICPECFRGHESLNVINYNGDEKENNQAIETFIDAMLAEEVDRERLLHVEDISVCDKINVIHPLDICKPYISGICGLGIRRWVAIDYDNTCVKVFEIGSNTLIKYIRFRSVVWGITEVIHPEYQTTNTVTSKESDDRTASHEKCALAVTLPEEKRVIFIGMDDNPVFKIGSIQTPNDCHDINYFNGLMFIDCPGSIYIMTVYGETLKKISVGVIDGRRFCVTLGRIYLIDGASDNVILINLDGDVIKKIPHLRSSDITVDENGDVYVCSGKLNSIFKLDKDLIKIKTLCEKTSLSSPSKVLWYSDKLYVYHSLKNESPLTIIQLT